MKYVCMKKIYRLFCLIFIRHQKPLCLFQKLPLKKEKLRKEKIIKTIIYKVGFINLTVCVVVVFISRKEQN